MIALFPNPSSGQLYAGDEGHLVSFRVFVIPLRPAVGLPKDNVWALKEIWDFAAKSIDGVLPSSEQFIPVDGRHAPRSSNQPLQKVPYLIGVTPFHARAIYFRGG